MAEPEPKPPQRSGLGLIVLWQLFLQPLHVYRMQKLIEHQAKDRVVNVRSRANLYQTIERLMRLGLVEVHETVHNQGLPDRIVYAITDSGRRVARQWLREMLHTTGREYPEFIAALSVMFGLEPDDARRQLEARAQQLAAELAEVESALTSYPHVPRLFLLEEEYRGALLRAQLDWIRGVVDDLSGGRLTWSERWLQEIAGRIGLPTDDEGDRSR